MFCVTSKVSLLPARPSSAPESQGQFRRPERVNQGTCPYDPPLIAASADITAKQMAVILGIPLRTIERELASMQRNGTIRHEGKARTGHWVILK